MTPSGATGGAFGRSLGELFGGLGSLLGSNLGVVGASETHLAAYTFKRGGPLLLAPFLDAKIALRGPQNGPKRFPNDTKIAEL